MNDRKVYYSLSPVTSYGNLKKPLLFALFLTGLYFLGELFPNSKDYLAPTPRLILLMLAYVSVVVYTQTRKFVNQIRLDYTLKQIEVDYIKGFREISIEYPFANFSYRIEERTLRHSNRYKVLLIDFPGLRLQMSELEYGFTARGLEALAKDLELVRKNYGPAVGRRKRRKLT